MPVHPFVSLEKTIGFSFQDKDLLAQALTHRSAVKAAREHGHNERLEFLGDAVLELVTTEHLFHVTDRPEGELTNWRSALVRRENLAAVAGELRLGDYLFLSRGEEASGGRARESNLANALEALIGAIHLDRGFDTAKSFCSEFILTRLEDLLRHGKDRDEKSRFQEKAQEHLGVTPHYETIGAIGPDHQKRFTCAVFLVKDKIAEGEGISKKRAEQAAAASALRKKKWS